MKRTPHDLGAKLDRLLSRHRSPSPDRMQAAIDRVGRQVGSSAEIRTVSVASASRRKPRRWAYASVAAMVTLAAAIGTAMLWPQQETALYRVLDGGVYRADPPSLLRRFGGTGTIRSNGGGGAVLALADGSRIEMRSHTELSLDRANDGMVIRLSSGGIIVIAAKQPTGHLYVQTKDMTVSVVGTVFLVNADEQGSRVAVIEGEVRVQQGTTERKLRPGERAATGPNTETFSVASEVAWSRRAASLLELLRKQAPVEQQSGVAAQAPKEPRLAFEVTSVRPSGDPPAPGPGTRGGGGGGVGGAINGCSPTSSGYRQQLDPTRLAITRATAFQLIAWAYPIPGVPDLGPFGLCVMLSKQVEMISGGPAWLKTDLWDLETRIPEGIFSSKPANADPRLLQMLQALMVDRFTLTMRRETRNVSVYLLKIGPDGPRFNGRRQGGRQLMRLDRDGKPLPDQETRAADGQITMSPRRLSAGVFSNYFDAYNVSMERLARELTGVLDRPVLNRTGLEGRFDFHHVSDVPIDLADPDKLESGMAAARRAVVKTVGLELEESRAPFDVWIIERAERPSEN